MEILVLQIIFSLVTFFVTLLCLLLPLKVFPREPGRSLGVKSQRVLSLSNCVSGGVFLGVCFVGLIPFVREKFQEAFNSNNIYLKYPVTETVVVVGFFIVLAIEQCVRSYKGSHKDVEDVQLVKYPMEYFSYSEDGSTGSDDSEAEEERRNLKKNQSSDPLLCSDQTPNGASATAPASDASPPKHGNRKRNRVTIRTQKHKKGSNDQSAPHHTGGHGHSHSVDLSHGFSLRAAIMLLALSIHSLFEGMTIGLQDDFGKLINLFISVLVHECLVCFAVGISLAKQDAKMGTLVKLAILFCSMIPVGILLGMGVGEIHNFGGYLASAIIQAVAAGTFLYVIFMESLPVEFENEQDPFLKVTFLLLGFILMACLRAITVDN